MNSVYKKSVPEGVLDAPSSSPYSKTTPKDELKSLQNIVAQGNFTNDDHSAFTWALDDTGLLTIDGKGSMPNWSWNSYLLHNRPWDSANDKIISVQISNGITSIGEYAFHGCNNLTEVHIFDSVTSIGDNAFENCTSLTEINIPDSVTSIRSGVFEDCASLREIHIPNSVTYIGRRAFENCTNLQKINIPDSVKHIDEYAFEYCTRLREIYIPSSVAELEAGVFNGCPGLTHVTMPARFNGLLFKFYYGIPKSIVTFY